MLETGLEPSIEVELLDSVEIGLQSLFRRLGPLIPADPHVLATLWPDRRPPVVDELAEGIARQVALGRLRIVHLGDEPHLTPLSRYETATADRTEMEQLRAPRELARGSAARALQAPRSDDARDDVQQLELAIDAEHERVVLYRVLIVMEVIGLLLFARTLWL